MTRFFKLFFISFLTITLFISSLSFSKPALAKEPWNWIKSVTVTPNTFKFGQTVNTTISVEVNEGPWLPADLKGEYLGVSYILPYLDENGQEIYKYTTIFYNPARKAFVGNLYTDFIYDQTGIWEIDTITANWASLKALNSNVYEYDKNRPSNESWQNLSAGNITLKDPDPGWLYFEGTWYYLNKNLDPVTGWLYDRGKWYYLNIDDGSMKTGWIFDKGKWYYLDPINGHMRIGWVKDGSRWYYLGSNGARQTGWLKDGKSWYYLYGDGTMLTGWLTLGTTKYYLNSNGAMQVGWLKIGSNWYYFNSSGSMVTSKVTISGKVYYFSRTGIWLR